MLRAIVRRSLPQVIADAIHPPVPEASPAIHLSMAMLCSDCEHIVYAEPACSRCGSRSLYPVQARMDPGSVVAFRPRAVGEVKG